jgi:hypothetical protein
MSVRRTHIVIPDDLAREIDRFVGKRGRSAFLAQAARKELRRLAILRALEHAAGSWKDKDHPELEKGSAQWVEILRKQDEQRFQKLTGRSKR